MQKSGTLTVKKGDGSVGRGRLNDLGAGLQAVWDRTLIDLSQSHTSRGEKFCELRRVGAGAAKSAN